MPVARSVAGAIVVAAISSSLGAQSSPIDRVAWMAGCWEMRAPNRVIIEMWMPPLGGMMMGASRTVIGGVTREYEQLRLTARGDTLVYTALPSGQKETDFKTTATNAMPIMFENRQHDFPQAILYRRAGADSLIARVEGPGPNNTTRGQDFPMRRASCTTPPAPPAPPDSLTFDAHLSPDGKQLLVVKAVGANFDVFAMNADLSGTRQLTMDASTDYQPSWSPDGKRIAFVSARDGHQEIYTMRPDGSDVVQLTHGTAHNSEPTWSPDGKSIAFRSERDEKRVHIYVMNPDGSNQRALTRDTTGGGSPTWSPDSKRIAFVSTRTKRSQIYAMNADGSGQVMLTNIPEGHASVPRWSPNGAKIAFTSNAGGNFDVYVMNADGTGIENLTKHPAQDSVLEWSADSASLLIRSSRDRAANDIYRLRVATGELVRVTVTK